MRKESAKAKELRRKSHALIPGGCHTNAKGDDQFPILAPGFIVRGEGSHVWDIDGKEYIEYGMGNRCVTLGHAFEPVVEAAAGEMRRGVNFTRPASIEVECAEQFLRMIPGAEMVKFTKNGSDATTAAVKLARAHTGRDLVALCSDHPFFSTDDWFIGTTALDAGIPQAIKQLTVTFRYNDLESVQKLFDEHAGRIACVILEPAKYDDPQEGFLHKVQELCRKNGAVFILDEMITGFRWDNGGAQAVYDIVPDLSVFGKALGNGFSVSALAGKRELMERGGLRDSRERVFLLSTTHGGETHALAAAIATMRTYENEPVVETLYRQGTRLAAGLHEVIALHELGDYVKVVGRPCSLVHVTLDKNHQRSQEFRTLLLQETIKRGVIMPSLVVSYAHRNEDIDRTVEAWDESLAIYKKALEEGVEKYLVGPPSKSVYRKYN
ncbi:MAG: glutamate-1-semialdehyde 2,1-aminomutase [Planctomycetes bacterium]|nr:glutamate-1-semialdehyde 2,1-aminomutase [Planctomycetota bacterium]